MRASLAVTIIARQLPAHFNALCPDRLREESQPSVIVAPPASRRVADEASTVMAETC